MRVVALDPSLTAFGWARSRAGPALGDPWESGVFKPKGRGVVRLQRILDRVVEVTDGADVALIEGYSFGSRGRATFSLGELGGVLRLALHQRGIPFVEISPASVKMLATGRGNAPKEEVLVEAVKRLGFQGSDHNRADSLWIMQAALIHYGLPGAADLPKQNLRALEKIEWPELGALVR